MSCTPRPATSKGPLTSDGLGGLGAQIAPEDYLQNRRLWLTFRNEKGIISRGKREPSLLHCSAPCLRPPPPHGQQGRGAVTKPCQTSRDEQLGRLVLPGLKPAMGRPPPPDVGQTRVSGQTGTTKLGLGLSDTGLWLWALERWVARSESPPPGPCNSRGSPRGAVAAGRGGTPWSSRPSHSRGHTRPLPPTR